MATATKKHRADAHVTPDARDLSEVAPLEFLVYLDNLGGYHWEIAEASGERLAHSAAFASHDEAQRAARYVYDGARAARFDPHAAEQRWPEGT